MPIARIDLRQGKSTEYLTKVGDIVYDSMTKLLGVPEGGRFQVITEHPPEGINACENYSGIRRTEECVIVQVTVNQGKTVDMKKASYQGVCEGLHEGLHEAVGLRREDVFINILEVTKEDWSTGNGVMTYQHKGPRT